MPSTELVQITVGGVPYGGWKSMSVAINARSPERTFQILGAMANPPIVAAALAINENDPCTLTSNGDILCVGKVERIEVSLDAGNHEIRITGKSKGADAAMSSVKHDTHEWRKKTPLQIAREVDTSGIGYRADCELEPIEVARCNVGATQMKLLGPLIEKQGVWMVSDDNGGILFTKHGQKRHAGGIIEGDNFLRGTASWSTENRAEKTTVLGHRHRGTGEKNVRYSKTVTDGGGKPGTHRVIVPRADMSKDEAQKLADHVASNRFGDGVQLQVELQGFRDMAGMLWHVGYLVWCEAPSLRGLAMDLAVNDLNFSQDEGGSGSLTKMTLVHPEALGSKTGQKSTKFNKQGQGSWRNKLENK